MTREVNAALDAKYRHAASARSLQSSNRQALIVGMSEALN